MGFSDIVVGMVALGFTSAYIYLMYFREPFWFKQAVNATPQPMPYWAFAYIVSECMELGIRMPRHMSLRVIKSKTLGVGGWTTDFEGGELVLVYESKYYDNYKPHDRGLEGPYTEDEMETLLHELAHWTIGPEEHHSDGHTARYYAELTRLCLKYGVPLDIMQESEKNYTGDMVFAGMERFHTIYNEALNNEDRESGAPR